jgi:hypothetical protein
MNARGLAETAHGLAAGPPRRPQNAMVRPTKPTGSTGVPGKRRAQRVTEPEPPSSATQAGIGVRARLPRRVGVNIGIFLFLPVLLSAQNAPHLAYALPAGGQQGATIEVTLGGQFLQSVTDPYISGAGVLAKVINAARPMNGTQATTLRDRMLELQKQPIDAAVFQEMTDIRAKLLIFSRTRLTSPVLAETLILRVAISSDAPPGKRELRVASPQGLSNPLIFCVGQLPEFRENETVAVIPPPGNQLNINQVQVIEPPTDMAITLPAVVNGRIKPRLAKPQPGRPGQTFTPGEADRYRFQARQGQQLVIAASARELMPYLADAVPGWFQAVLTLYDAAGKEVAYDDDYRFHPDPVLHYVVPHDSEYTVEIRDALYRGREDFVYRIAIGELPFVTGIFPLGGPAGSRTEVELSGWNLPAKRLTFDAQEKAPGIYPLDGQPFQVESLPEALEKEPNNDAATAQRVKLPIILNGRIDHPGDWDVFRFEGRAGETIVAEVYARRLDSPLDSVLRLTDAAGQQIAFNDDSPDEGAGLETHHADSRIMVKLPTAGSYYLYLGDVQQKGGPEYTYRLRIGAPRPDFELRVTPSAINAGPGLSVPLAVHALRKDGFSGAIVLDLKDAPRGLRLNGAVIPAGQDQVRLTLTIPPQIQREPLPLVLEGHAPIEGRVVSRLAVPAEDMMQAFFYRHLVPAAGLQLAVRRGVALRTPARVVSAETLRIAAGETARLRVEIALPPNSPIGNIQYELNDPPEGIALKEVSVVPGGAEIVLECDRAKAKPGLQGNLIIDISGERTAPAANGKPAAANRQRVSLGTLPAVPFEIVKARD